MARKKKELQVISEEEYRKVVDNYDKELASNPKYSLEVDPENKYNMSDIQKSFIETYCELKSVPMTADFLKIDIETAMTIFSLYSSKKEIERINMAQLHRRIRKKMWDYDEIGGYLTTLLTDENVPLADRLHTKDKIGVAKILIDLNDRKAALVNKPMQVNDVDLDKELKELSVDAIKALLEQDDLKSQKTDIVDRIKKVTPLTIEEEQMLKTMSLPELLKFLNDSGGY